MDWLPKKGRNVAHRLKIKAIRPVPAAHQGWPRRALATGLGPACVDLARRGFFIFFYFYFCFLQKYIFDLKIYRNIPRPPRCRAAAGRQGLLCKKFCSNNCAQVPVGRSPGSGAAGPGRPALPPLYKGWLVPPALICITKILENKKKEREGERRSPVGFSSRRLQVTKILLRFTNIMIVCPDMSSNYFCCNYFCWNSRLAINLISWLCVQICQASFVFKFIMVTDIFLMMRME